MRNKPVTNVRVTRWLLLLQEFDITIIDRPGNDNVVADFLSRLTNESEAIPVEDHFPDEHLFAIFTNIPLCVDITDYLVAGKLPDHLSPKVKKQIIRQSARFSWIEGYLFHIGLDLIVHRCIPDDEIYNIVRACHDEPCGGHFSDKMTRNKVLRMGYY